jgi:hypothetical protein
MCTFKDESKVLVCDVAIDRVRREMDSTFSEGVHYTVIAGQGTLAEADDGVDSRLFAETASRAIAQAQGPSGTG